MVNFNPSPEFWKSIDHTRYLVSDQGRVQRNGRILKPYPSRKYLVVDIYVQGKRQAIYVHRLVAMVFIPNPDDKPEINHKNGNPKDNRIDNLEWVTKSENAIHAYENGLRVPPNLRGAKHGCAKLSQPQIDEIRLLRKGGMEQQALADKYGVSQSAISRIINKRTYKE